MKVTRGNITQVTLDDKRWYINHDTGETVPSITWVLESFPKDHFFHNYLMSLPSPEYGKQVLRDAGDKGSRVHWGIEQFLSGVQLRYTDVPYGYDYSFTPGEWQMIQHGFMNWYEKLPQDFAIQSIEETAWGDGYAGTVDLVCLLDGRLTVIDWKTSKAIYDGYKCQVAAYCKAIGAERGMIVQLGSKTKQGYSVWDTDKSAEKSGRDIDYYYELFGNVKAIWDHLNPDPHPRTMDIQETLSIHQEVANGVA